MTPNQYYEMPYTDMETLRRFLVEQNDEGKLNLNSLCIVGAEMGASVAVYYALHDWTTPRREASRVTPAQDVRALVLISPEWAFPGLPLKRPLTNPFIRSQIAMMIIVGRQNSKALADARGMYKLLKPHHPDKEDIKDQDLVFLDPRTKLQGTKMLGVESLNLERIIGRFIELRVVDQRYRWEQRGSR
jgi:pimeloyl-ACP methyl ester carboxylesterase